MTNITVIKGDLPNNIRWPKMIAVDTETTGLDVVHDRLCLVQIGDGKGNMWLVQILPGKRYTNLKKVFTKRINYYIIINAWKMFR